MFATFLMVVLTQVIPCTPGEMSAVCTCKAGMLSACAALVADEPGKAALLLDQVEAALDALEMAGKAKSDKDKEEETQLQEMAQALSGAQTSSEPPNCKGQEHHPSRDVLPDRWRKIPTSRGSSSPETRDT